MCQSSPAQLMLYWMLVMRQSRISFRAITLTFCLLTREHTTEVNQHHERLAEMGRDFDRVADALQSHSAQVESLTRENALLRRKLTAYSGGGVEGDDARGEDSEDIINMGAAGVRDISAGTPRQPSFSIAHDVVHHSHTA